MSDPKKNTALILIDFQCGFSGPNWGRRNLPQAEQTAAWLLGQFRNRGLPIFHVQHLSRSPGSPLRPGQPGVDFMQGLEPVLGERIFQKHVNSAFIGTDLEPALRRDGIERTVICGIAVDHCVSTTARMAANLEFEVIIVADATPAHERKAYDGRVFDADLVHAVTLASLNGEFAEIMDAQNVFEVLEGVQ